MLDGTSYRLSLLAVLISSAACADVGGGTADDSASDASASVGSTTLPGSYDAGATRADAGAYTSPGSAGGNGGSSSASGNGIDFTVNDAAVDLDDLLNAGGSLLGGGSDGGTSGGASSSAPKGDGGTVAQCQNAICFDVFDCYIFHPDLVDCGFTACDGFVCK